MKGRFKYFKGKVRRFFNGSPWKGCYQYPQNMDKIIKEKTSWPRSLPPIHRPLEKGARAPPRSILYSVKQHLFKG